MGEDLLLKYFVSHLLGSHTSKERETFVTAIVQSAKEGHLCTSYPNTPAMPAAIMSEGTEKFPQTPLVQWKNLYYLQKNWVYETLVLEHLQRLEKVKHPKNWRGMEFIDPSVCRLFHLNALRTRRRVRIEANGDVTVKGGRQKATSSVYPYNLSETPKSIREARLDTIVSLDGKDYDNSSLHYMD